MDAFDLFKEVFLKLSSIDGKVEAVQIDTEEIPKDTVRELKGYLSSMNIDIVEGRNHLTCIPQHGRKTMIATVVLPKDDNDCLDLREK